MALRLSTGLRNALLDQESEATNLMTGTDIAFEDGTGTDSRDRITRVAGGLDVFDKKKYITVAGSAGGTNDGTYEILASADGYVEVAAGSLATEAAGEQIILADATGGSLSDLFRNCVIDVYSGSQPADADTAESGTKLVTITLSSGAFSGGAAANGLNFGEVASGVLTKQSDETWSGEGLANGTAGWFRVYDNNYTTGASTTAIRLDGSVSTSGSQFNMSNTAISIGGTTTIDTVQLTLPAS
jgi:hypothetical protein